MGNSQQVSLTLGIFSLKMPEEYNQNEMAKQDTGHWNFEYG